MRKVFLDDLPKKIGIGVHSEELVIDWKNSVGLLVECKYDDIEICIEIKDYKNQRVTIFNEEYGEYEMKANNFKECQLANYLKLKTSKFKYNIGHKVINEKRNYTVLNREYVENKYGFKDKYYICKCNLCECETIKVEEYRLNKSQYCPCCGKSPRIIQSGINTIWDTDRWMVDLGVSEEDAKKYTKSQSVNIDVICPHCKEVKRRNISKIYTYKTISCQCGDKNSYISKYLYKFLKQLNVDLGKEVKFEWCNYYNHYKEKEVFGIYDFVIENMKLIVEADGEFHRRDNKMNGQCVEESKFIDNKKDILANENGYEVIRISNEGNVKENIINSKINELFDLSVVDWDKCEEFALSNLVKLICEAWNNKESEQTTLDIANMLDLSPTTIRRSLNKGNKLKWCNYDGKKELVKNFKRNKKQEGVA